MTLHPDESTFHALVDGELTAGEAATLEEHVAVCSQCAAALAEARGLAAGASRVVNALDGSPSSAGRARPLQGTAAVPAMAPRPRPMVSRIPYARAAALLLLVGGTAVVLDRSVLPNDQPELSSSAAVGSAAPASVAPASVAPASVAPASVAVVVPPPARTTNARMKAAPLPAAAATGGYSERRVTSEADFSGSGVAGGRASVPTTQDLAVVAPPSPPVAVRERAPKPLSRALGLEGTVATGAMAEASPAPRITRYRLENGVILTLTDEPLRASFAAEGESQRKVSQMNPAVHTYRWHSRELGRSYTLTGPLSVTDLEVAARRLAELVPVP